MRFVSQRGFSLIELMIVVAIIGILSALVMANLVGIRQRARDGQRKADLRHRYGESGAQRRLRLLRAAHRLRRPRRPGPYRGAAERSVAAAALGTPEAPGRSGRAARSAGRSRPPAGSPGRPRDRKSVV